MYYVGKLQQKSGDLHVVFANPPSSVYRRCLNYASDLSF